MFAIGRKLVLFALLLLCQTTSMGCTQKVPSQTSVSQQQQQQLEIALESLPVFLEARKGKSGFGTVPVQTYLSATHRSVSSLPLRLSEKCNRSTEAPLGKKGYWLIYRRLLI